jgi:hypothetical protein
MAQMTDSTAGAVGGGLGGAVGGVLATQTSFGIAAVGASAALGSLVGLLGYYVVTRAASSE